MFLRCLLILLFCWAGCLSGEGQEHSYLFSRLDVTGGLSHNQVNTILRDRTGFVWLGTMSGLNRFDGYSVRTFRQRPGDSASLNDNYISALFEAPGGLLWINTRSGASLYDSRTERFNPSVQPYLASLGLPGTVVRQILPTRSGQYWFVLDSGLYRVPAAGKRAVRIATDGERGSVISIAEGKGGTIWAIRRDGLLMGLQEADGQAVTRSPALQQLNGHVAAEYQLFADADGDLWIWTISQTRGPKGAFHWNPATGRVVHYHSGNPGARLAADLINGIIQDRKGMIWIGTDHGGINLVDKKTGRIRQLLHNPGDPKSLSQNSIYTLYRDRDGMIWAGTFKQGVSYQNDRIVKFPHYRNQAGDPHSLSFDDVNQFVEDPKGNIWIGANGGGLIYFDRASGRFTQYLHNPDNPRSLSNNVIVSLHMDKKGVVWAGTYTGGLNRFDGNGFTHFRQRPGDSTSLSDDRVWEILEDRSGRLWVGTLDGGLNLMDREKGTFRRFNQQQGQLQSNYISALTEDREGNLWIGTAFGIDVLQKDGRFRHYLGNGQPGSLSNNNMISLLIDRRGLLWAGTREGLNLLNPRTNTFRTFTTEHGLPDNTILTLTEDREGGIWITTPNGLASLKVEGTDAANLRFTVREYDEANNLQGREWNENAALRLRSGELIVGGPSGFNLIDPGAFPVAAQPPVIVFTSFHIFNQPVEAGRPFNGRVVLPESITGAETVQLRYDQNVFSIEFAALDFAHGRKSRYAYKMEGFNRDWLYTDGSQRRITFTNLDPGTYTFKVRATNPDGSWNEKVKSLKVIIRPPFWRTPLAFVLYALLLGLVLWLARRFLLERARMRFEVEQQRKEAERVQALDALKTKFFTNVSHEFRTPLSLILSPLDRILKHLQDGDQKKQLQLVQRNAKRLLNLVNQLLDFRKMEVQEFKLHPTLGDIVRFTRDISYSFTDIAENKHIRFSFHSEIPSLETYFDKDKLEKILFNLLSNAFKYTHQDGSVQVTLDYRPPVGAETEGSLLLTVQDTGIGIPADKQEKIFERFFQNDVPDNMINQGSGIGLVITREFVKLHGGTITVNSVPEKGSAFLVTLPVKTAGEPVPLSDIPGPEVENTISEGEEPAEDGRTRRTTILLVEDNEDFRFYLKDNLKQHYTVVEASNGKDGWEKVKNGQPDLVVSDIMMPGLSGIELSRRMKNDPRTAHIPIILLTAMSSEATQVEGFQVGASDYITKPFTFEILASRIRNLMARQKQLRKNFQKQLEVNPASLAVTPVDEQFLKNALAAVDKGMSNPDFGVEELSKELYMSRVALYKKLLSLTGKTPLEFIRILRLKRGAQLLERSGLTIAEVAYQVGFNNPKIFSKYFREEFGQTPSVYQASRKEEKSLKESPDS
ncbi:MAG TPA: two-component regulator propeller domain-containing protein [Chitinophagaceae bacterium]|jgi:signal transduction histidine kinase/ligand-binding sensor domain-containing protein/CheY-like chemotaxis protein|nr:two-component regulator propeller domain-containing protein [Chitinophagaceae bacterium]